MGRYDFSCNTGVKPISDNDTSTTLRVYCYWKNNGWGYYMRPIYGWVTCNGEERLVYNAGYPDFSGDINGQYELGYSDYTINKGTSSKSIAYSARLRSDSGYASGERTSGTGYATVGALSSYKITYNANGGSGAPGQDTKYYGVTKQLSSTIPTRTGYTFVKWNTKADGTGTNYNPGANYTSNSAVTLYAIWSIITYTVSYDANDGSGAPSNQTKSYGVDLRLSSVIPTRTDYNFKGWATSSSGAVTYQPGDTYTGNSDIILYAIWEVAYIRPRINNLNIFRCNSHGVANDSGSYLKVDFSWEIDMPNLFAYLYYEEAGTENWQIVNIIYNQNMGYGGTINRIYNLSLSSDKSYVAKILVYDKKGRTYGTYSADISIGTTSYPIDVKSKGKGVAFGKVAENDDMFDVNYTAIFRKQVRFLNMNFIKKFILDTFYPVGKLYISTDPTDPSTFLGGYWERMKDRFLLAAGDTYAAGSTGGEATHKLTKNELPKIEGSFSTTVPGSHNNYTTGVFTGDSSTWSGQTLVANQQSGHDMWGYKISFGNNQAHNNMPPYIAVYVWKRIIPELYYEVETEPELGYSELCTFQLNNDNYYENQNKRTSETSFSYATIHIHNGTNSNHSCKIDYVDYGEKGKAFGAISIIDPTMAYFGYDISYPYSEECTVYDANVTPSTSVRSCTISVPPGDHTIIIKYIRSESTTKTNDYFKFKITLT
jgi:uncharacterized repeat protein (TIGR02543 family)